VIRFLLDTNICIELIRNRSQRILNRLRRKKIGTVGISTITLAELRYGVAHSSDPQRNLLALLHFCAALDILPFDARAASAYGEVRNSLQRIGTPIGPLDMLIAAHAVSLKAIVVTNNEREFRRVEGLAVENWTLS
jgi:tRNA(fMet)-specific endonuclease VapC